MKLNTNNISSNKLLSNLNAEQQAINEAPIDNNLSFKKFVVAFANKHLVSQVNSDTSGLENNNDLKPRQILSKLENHPDLINLLNKVKEVTRGNENLNALYEFNALANNFVKEPFTPDYSATIHSIVMDLNSLDITPLQRIEVFYLVLFHNFNGGKITDSEIEEKNNQGGYKAPLSRHSSSVAKDVSIYNSENNEILNMSNYKNAFGYIDLLKREKDIQNIQNKDNLFIRRCYQSLDKVFLLYLSEIKDYHKFVWEALDMLGDGFIDDRVTIATFVGMDNLLEKVITDSELGKHIVKQFYRFTKANGMNSDFKSANTKLDEFIDLLKTILEPDKYRQGENLFSYVYRKLHVLCRYLCHPYTFCNPYPDRYNEATDDLLDPDKSHIWLRIKSFFFWVFNKKTYDDTYAEVVCCELKKQFCELCRSALDFSVLYSSCREAWQMRTFLTPVKKEKNLDAITNDKDQPSDENKNKIDEIDKPEPKLAAPENTLQANHEAIK